MVVFSEVTQGKKETIWVYIDCFIKVVVVVEGLDVSFKCWFLRRALDQIVHSRRS